MASVTIGDVISRAQIKLGDEGGELFTTVNLLTHAISAYGDLYRLLMNITSVRAKRVRYIRIPANTSSFTFDYDNMAPNWESGIELGDRQEDSSQVIVNVGNTGTDNILVITAGPHGLAVGNMAALIGTGRRWLDGLHAVTETTTPTSFFVRGTLATGINGAAASSAIVSVATQGFQRVEVTDLIRQWPASPAARIDRIAYSENEMQFWPCSTTRQMRLMYDCSGDDIANTNDLIGVDGTLDFLAAVTGAYAAHAKGATTKYAELSNLAFGTSGDWNRSRPDGGLARAILATHVRALQQTQCARPPWRQRKVPTTSAFPIG